MAFQVLANNLVAAAAGTDVTLELGVVPSNFSQGTWLPLRASLTSPALLTGATATAITFSFRANRAGTPQTAFATLTTATGTNLAAGVEVSVTITSGTALLAGDVIELVLTHASTGTAYGAIHARVELA